MNTIKDGGPAFPCVAENGLGHISDGMSLRDYFAAKAMSHEFAIKPLSERRYFQKICAEQAYMMADAMLAAREAQP